jgi:hypothetical protein
MYSIAVKKWSLSFPEFRHFNFSRVPAHAESENLLARSRLTEPILGVKMAVESFRTMYMYHMVS